MVSQKLKEEIKKFLEEELPVIGGMEPHTAIIVGIELILKALIEDEKL